MRSPAGDVPVHSGTSAAGGGASNRSRPAAAHDWEEGACDQAKGVGRVACGQEVSRAGRSSLSARSARLTSCPCRWPHCCSDFLVKRVGSKSNRVTAGIIGGGATDKATRPTGGLTLSRQKEPTGEFLPNPPSPDRQGGAYAKGSLTAGTNTRRSPAFSATLSAVRCFPLWRTLVLSFPRYPGDTSRCWLRQPTRSALRAHNSCTAFVPTDQ